MKKRSLLSAIVVCFLYSCAESEVESNLDSAISDKREQKGNHLLRITRQCHQI